jgi:hypothetical protein
LRGLSLAPYSPKCGEGEFCELRLYRILGNSLPLGRRRAYSAISSNHAKGRTSNFAFAEFHEVHRSNHSRWGLGGRTEASDRFKNGGIMPRVMWRMLVLAALVFASGFMLRVAWETFDEHPNQLGEVCY